MRIFSTIGLCAALLCGCANSVPTVPEAPPAEDVSSHSTEKVVREYLLSNGMHLMVSPADYTNRVTAWVVVDAGSMENPTDASGLAHYVEHIVAGKGSRTMGTIDYEAEQPYLEKIEELYAKMQTLPRSERKPLLDEIYRLEGEASQFLIPHELGDMMNDIGGRGSNASTRSYDTRYVVDIPANQLKRWAVVNADRFQNPVFRDMGRELEVVFQEYNSWQDTPNSVMWDLTVREMFRDHPLGVSNIGILEDLKHNITPQKARAFFEKYYAPSNMRIVIAGNVGDPDDVRDLMEQTFGKIPARPYTEPEVHASTVTEPSEIEFIHKGHDRIRLAWRVHMPAKDMRPYFMADAILSNGKTGILNRLVQDQKILSAYSSFFILDKKEEAMFLIDGNAREGQSMEEMQELLLAALDEARSGAFTQEEIETIELNWGINRDENWQKMNKRVSSMTTAAAMDMSWDEYQAWLEKPVTVQEVQAALAALPATPTTIVRKPSGEPSIPAVEAPKILPAEKFATGHSAMYESAMAIPVDDVRVKTLISGEDYAVVDTDRERWIMSQNPESQLARVNLWWRHGSLNNERLIFSLSLVDRNGITGSSKYEFEKALYRLGASVSYSSGGRWTGLSFRAPAENINEVIQLAAKRLANPGVTSEFITKYASDISKYRSSYNQANSRFSLLRSHLVLGPQSSNHQTLRTAAIGDLTLEDVQQDVNELLSYTPMVLYSGNADWQQIRETLDQSGLIGSVTPPEQEATLSLPGGSGSYFLDASNSGQSFIDFEFPASTFSTEDNARYQLAQEYLGGSTGLVFQDLREARSLAYSAYGGFDRGNEIAEPNRVWLYAKVQNDNVGATIARLQELMTVGLSDEDRWNRARESAMSSLLYHEVPPASIPGFVFGFLTTGYDSDPRARLISELERLTPLEMELFLRGIVETPPTIMVTGDPQILEQLPPDVRVLTDDEVTSW